MSDVIVFMGPEVIQITIDDALLDFILDDETTLGGEVVTLGGESVTFGEGE